MNFFDSKMADEGHGWMYDSWKKSGAHMKEWMNKTQEFIDRAFPYQTIRCEVSM
jgi:hypothetical protein